MPDINYLAIAPFLALSGMALLLLIVSSLIERRLSTRWATSLAVTAAAAALATTVFQAWRIAHHGAITTAAHSVVMDGFSTAMTGSIASSLIFALLIAHDWEIREKFAGAEYQMLALLATSGAVLMTEANDLALIFLGLEILSIALYVIIAFNRRRVKSQESSMKYFLLGGFAAAIFIYGVALVYGAIGSTNVTTIAYFLGSNVLLHPGLLWAGGGLMMLAFAFKTQAVPFHFWSPDVYEGAPTPVTGFHASIVWGGAFAAATRVMLGALGTQQATWRPIIWALIVGSTVIGALFTIQQTNAKRLLAYSSVTHSGFIWLAVWAATTRGVTDVVFYVMTYAPTVLGSFAVAALVAGPGDAEHYLERYCGLARRNPWLGGALAILLLSQLGIPGTVGFDAKFAVLSASIDTGNMAASLIAIFAACIAAYAYLRWVALLYQSPADDALALEVPWASRVVVGCVVVVAVVGGLWPAPLMALASHAHLIFQP